MIASKRKKNHRVLLVYTQSIKSSAVSASSLKQTSKEGSCSREKQEGKKQVISGLDLHAKNGSLLLLRICLNAFPVGSILSWPSSLRIRGHLYWRHRLFLHRCVTSTADLRRCVSKKSCHPLSLFGCEGNLLTCLMFRVFSLSLVCVNVIIRTETSLSSE